MSNTIIPQNGDNVKHRQQIALFLTRQGFSLLPLLPASKIPYMELLPSTRQGQASWSLYSLRPASESEVKDWFAFNPECNYGILTGPASIGGLYVLDVDQAEKLPKEELPSTVCVKTGRGLHYYFKHEGELPGRNFDFGELKGKNAYIVGPGSVHESGAVYRFLDTLSLADVSIADLPSWLESPAQAAEPITDAVKTPSTSKPLNHKSIGEARKDSITCYTPDFKTDILGLAGDEDVAIAAMSLCGVEGVRMGKVFRCPLPEHDDEKPSAALWKKGDNGLIMMHDFHKQTWLSKPSGFTDEEGHVIWWPLPDVYAATVTRRTELLRRGERAIWMLRMLHAAGVVNPPVLKAYELPGDAPKSAKKLYGGFVYLMELRQLYEPQNSAPFSWSFAAAWCGIGSPSTVKKAMRYLLERGYLFMRQPGVKIGEGEGPRAALFSIGRPR